MSPSETLGLINSAISLLSLSSGGRLKEYDALGKIQSYNAKSRYRKEWIADLDINPRGEIVITDPQFSEKIAESEMSWDEHITHTDPYSDPEHCVGYVHFHPPMVDDRPSAQDFILALTIHKLRVEANKEKHPSTMFGVVTADKVQFYMIRPKRSFKGTLKKFKEIEKKGDKLSNVEYFQKVRKVKREMIAKGELETTGWIPI